MSRKNASDIREDVTVVMETSQLSAEDFPSDDPDVHDSTPEMEERRSWRQRAEDLLNCFRFRELRDAHAEIEVRCQAGSRPEPVLEQVSVDRLSEIDELYRIGEKFAEGGQSILHFGEDLCLGRTVAIKTLKENPDDPTSSRLAFLHEAAVMAQLAHPSVAPAYALMRDRNDDLHLAMRYVSGITLQKYLRTLIHLYAENGVSAYDVRQNLFRLLEYFLRVCDVMEYAHARNVLHCDLKPENVIIGRFHDVYVMDWGISRAAVDKSKWVAPQKVTGTLRYLAPEIIRGRRPSVRSDIFSLGAILYEIVSLNNAYAGDSPAVIVKRQKKGRIGSFRHRFGARINRDLKAIVRKAVDPDPDRRYQSVAELANDIRRVRRNEEVSARPDSAMGKFVRWCANHPQTIAVSFIALFLALVAGLGFSAERAIHAAIAQRDYDAAVSGAFARTALGAQNINARFIRHVHLLNNLMEDYLMLRNTALAPDWSVNALTPQEESRSGGPAASTLAPSAAYHWPVDFRHLVYSMPSGASASEETRRNLRILAFMVPRLRHIVFKYSIGAEQPDSRTDAEIETQIRKEGTSPHRILFGFPDGLCCVYPGVAKPPEDFDPRECAWYRSASILQHNQSVWGRPYEEPQMPGKRFIICSMPIYDDYADGSLRAAVALELDMGLLSRRVSRVGNTGAHVKGKYLFDQYGRIYLSTAETKNARRLTATVAELAPRRRYGTLVENVDGKEYLWCFSYLPTPRLYYAEKIDLGEMQKKGR